jgi:hypothetical protein
MWSWRIFCSKIDCIAVACSGSIFRTVLIGSGLRLVVLKGSSFFFLKIRFLRLIIYCARKENELKCLFLRIELFCCEAEYFHFEFEPKFLWNSMINRLLMWVILKNLCWNLKEFRFDLFCLKNSERN